MNLFQNKKVQVLDLGLIDYKEAWDYQEKLFKETVEIKISNRKLRNQDQVPTNNHLIFCQHPHVFTLGKSGDEKNLLLDEKSLNEINASYYKINRGGDITYHGPGQIVCYPILDLENFFTDIHKYLRFLEEAVILTCNEYGVEFGRIDGLTGVWIEIDRPEKSRKVSAMGVKSSRWVTMHGLSFNVNTDLSYFDHIIPCGIEDKAVTSLSAEIGKTIDLNEAQNKLLNNLVSIFGFTLSD